MRQLCLQHKYCIYKIILKKPKLRKTKTWKANNYFGSGQRRWKFHNVNGQNSRRKTSTIIICPREQNFYGYIGFRVSHSCFLGNLAVPEPQY